MDPKSVACNNRLETSLSIKTVSAFTVKCKRSVSFSFSWLEGITPNTSEIWTTSLLDLRSRKEVSTDIFLSTDIESPSKRNAHRKIWFMWCCTMIIDTANHSFTGVVRVSELWMALVVTIGTLDMRGETMWGLAPDVVASCGSWVISFEQHHLYHIRPALSMYKSPREGLHIRYGQLHVSIKDTRISIDFHQSHVVNKSGTSMNRFQKIAG